MTKNLGTINTLRDLEAILHDQWLAYEYVKALRKKFEYEDYLEQESKRK